VDIPATWLGFPRLALIPVTNIWLLPANILPENSSRRFFPDLKLPGKTLGKIGNWYILISSVAERVLKRLK
jgi:hypothetical protein